MAGVGEGHEAVLLEEFWRVVRVFRTLSPSSQSIIRDITRRMGAGMAEFVQKDLGQGTQTHDEYGRYCHFVAGLVGIGLTQLFAARGTEDPRLTGCDEVANGMGLFLQKTNIIRDYLEDFVDGRAFWPKQVWAKYAPDNNLGHFSTDPSSRTSLACLNELVTDGLTHALTSLHYMSLVRTPEVFRFCAVPQVMAIATLEKCYNNPCVFTGVVKIRKGQACKLMLSCNNLDDVCTIFHQYATVILSRVPPHDPSAEKTRAVCSEILERTKGRVVSGGGSAAMIAPAVVAVVGVVWAVSAMKGTSE